MDSMSCSVMYLQAQCQHRLFGSIIPGDHGSESRLKYPQSFVRDASTIVGQGKTGRRYVLPFSTLVLQLRDVPPDVCGHTSSVTC